MVRPDITIANPPFGLRLVEVKRPHISPSMVIRNPRRDGVVGSRCASGGAQALSYLRAIPGAESVMFWNGPLLVMLHRSDLELTAYLCPLRRMVDAGPEAWAAFHEVFCRPGMKTINTAADRFFSGRKRDHWDSGITESTIVWRGPGTAWLFSMPTPSSPQSALAALGNASEGSIISRPLP